MKDINYTEFQINKDYRARADKHHWILEKYAGFDSKKNAQIWKSDGHFMQLRHLLSYVLDTLLRESGSSSIKELEIALREASCAIKDSLK